MLTLLMSVAPANLPAADPLALPPKQARRLIVSGRAPSGLRVTGHLDLSDQPSLRALPRGLSAPSINLSNCRNLTALPLDLRIRRLNVSGCTRLRTLPSGLHCSVLELRETDVRTLPPDLQVDFRLDLADCASLEYLPIGLTVGSLVLRGCVALTALPEGLDVCFLDISGCTGLIGWPRRGALRIGRLLARDCPRLTSLPPWLTRLTHLDVSGCTSLSDLPETLAIGTSLDLAGTGITALPPASVGVQLRWRGVPIDERIAFQPETLTVDEVLGTANVERRRVLLERMGYARFLANADVEILDHDVDAGGERQLVRVPLADDEPLVCVVVYCPSTGHQYMLRVPPTTTTCHQAVAWIAGFDAPDAYRPLVET